MRDLVDNPRFKPDDALTPADPALSIGDIAVFNNDGPAINGPAAKSGFAEPPTRSRAAAWRARCEYVGPRREVGEKVSSGEAVAVGESRSRVASGGSREWRRWNGIWRSAELDVGAGDVVGGMESAKGSKEPSVYGAEAGDVAEVAARAIVEMRYQERHLCTAAWKESAMKASSVQKKCTKFSAERNMVAFCCDLMAQQCFLGGASLRSCAATGT